MFKHIWHIALVSIPVLFSCTQKEQEPLIIPVESVSINQSSARLTIGETVQLTASVSPSTATNKEISWSSSNQSVASVNTSGLVTAAGEGTTIISASADGKKGECTVSVKKAYVAVSEVKLDKTELTLFEGKEETLTATILPKDATEQTITWSSSDPSIVTVVSGKVTAIKTGNTTISASVGGLKAECDVTVYLEYGKVAITDLKPVEILPIIGQVTNGDTDVYDHIEHLRIAEATRIRDMMWEYGAGSHSKESYQSLMSRLNTGMISELPLDYNDYVILGPEEGRAAPSGHAHSLWSILRELVKHANFYAIPHYTISSLNEEDILFRFLQSHPNTVNIFGKSFNSSYDSYENYAPAANYFKDTFDPIFSSENLLLFVAGTNIEMWDGILKNKIYNSEIIADAHGLYSDASRANSDKNDRPYSHLMVTVGTNAEGDIDQTNETQIGFSKFPVGFADNVLFSGRAFPFHSSSLSCYSAQGGKYQTSITNYLNVALAGLCFLIYSDVTNVDQLLEMIESTCLTDYIRLDLNGDGDTNDLVEGQPESQPLQLINPAGLYKKYLTPHNLPASILAGETINLDKGYYKGILFSIPGAEVKVNGEWIAFDNKNKDIIMFQNPMNLEWRLNGELLQKYGYTSGQTIEGQIITVDDKWGGLRLEVPMTIKIQ